MLRIVRQIYIYILLYFRIYIIYIYKYHIIYIPKMMPWHDSRPHFRTGGLFLHIHPCSSSTSCRGKIFASPGSPRPMPYVGVFNMLKRYAFHGDMKTPAFFAGLLWRFWGGKFVFSKWNWIKLASQKSKSYWYPGVIMIELRWCCKLFGYPSVREPQGVYLTGYSRNSTGLIASKSWVITISHSATEAT